MYVMRISLKPSLGANLWRFDMLTSITKLLSTMKTIHLIMLPMVLSLVPIIILVWIGSAGYRQTLAQNILSCITFFLWGCVGLPMIVRKEVPWLVTVRGWVAVVEGVILLLIGWVIAIGFIIQILNSLL